MTSPIDIFAKRPPKQEEERRIIDYCFSRIAPDQVPAAILQKYKEYKSEEDYPTLHDSIAMYTMLEEFITKNKPPIVRQETNKNQLREHIQSQYHLDSCQLSFNLIFLPEPRQRFEVYKICIQSVQKYLIRIVGPVRYGTLVKKTITGTPLAMLATDDTGIRYEPVASILSTIDKTTLTTIFKNLYKLLYDEVHISIGEMNARKIILSTYQDFKQDYDFSITSYMFEIVPEGIIEYERLLFTNRGTLERLIQERTAELEEIKLGLESNVAARTAELETAKRQVETVLTSIGDGVFAVDLQGNIILMNPIAEELSGFTFGEAIGKHYTQIFRFTSEEEQNVPYGPFVESVITNGKKQTLAAHTQIVQRSGKRISISDSAAPILDTQGKILGCVVVFRDFSRERELERAKDTFLSIAAHQLRTPLGSMRWNLEMLISGDVGTIDPAVREVVSQIYENDKRLISLVNDLLNVSRIDQKRVPYEAAKQDIIQITQNIIKEVDGLAKKRSVKIDLMFNTTQQFILNIDKKRFIESIENILSNAVKYSHFGGEVSIVIEKMSNRMIKIEITDSGIGIPEKDKSNMFSKFFRAENAIKSETEGTGLGLYVVRSYIEDMGGTVDYTSMENKGTTFTVMLPDK